MNSASTALAQKNAASAANSRVARSSSRRMLQGDLAGGGANGMVSGATAPPLMMKLIA